MRLTQQCLTNALQTGTPVSVNSTLVSLNNILVSLNSTAVSLNSVLVSLFTVPLNNGNGNTIYTKKVLVCSLHLSDTTQSRHPAQGILKEKARQHFYKLFISWFN